MLLVVGLTGLASSGKGEVSSYLADRHGFVKLVFSDVLREEAEKRGLLKDKSYEEQKLALSKLGEQLRKEYGRWDILAVRLIEKIKSSKFEKVVVDGFRSVEEVNLFRKNFEKFYLIFVDAEEKLRFSRRKLEDPKATIENFKERNKRDIEELGLGKVIEMADFKIDNSGTLEDLKDKINYFLNRLK